jgi:hypothetical protein
MASAWGKSWGAAFGVAFGLAVATPPTPAPAAPVAQIGGGGTSLADWERELDLQRHKQIQAEDEIIVTAIAQMIANGAFG